MRLFKFGLHLWIAITSALSFLGGWILLAHAPKPVQAATAASSPAVAVPTLAPLPPLDFSASANGPAPQAPQVIVQAPRPLAAMPVFRTGGS